MGFETWPSSDAACSMPAPTFEEGDTRDSPATQPSVTTRIRGSRRRSAPLATWPFGFAGRGDGVRCRHEPAVLSRRWPTLTVAMSSLWVSEPRTVRRWPVPMVALAVVALAVTGLHGAVPLRTGTSGGAERIRSGSPRPAGPVVQRPVTLVSTLTRRGRRCLTMWRSTRPGAALWWPRCRLSGQLRSWRVHHCRVGHRAPRSPGRCTRWSVADTDTMVRSEPWRGEGNVARRSVAAGMTEEVTVRTGEVEWDLVLASAPPRIGRHDRHRRAWRACMVGPCATAAVGGYRCRVARRFDSGDWSWSTGPERRLFAALPSIDGDRLSITRAGASPRRGPVSPDAGSDGQPRALRVRHRGQRVPVRPGLGL